MLVRRPSRMCHGEAVETWGPASMTPTTLLDRPSVRIPSRQLSGTSRVSRVAKYVHKCLEKEVRRYPMQSSIVWEVDRTRLEPSTLLSITKKFAFMAGCTGHGDDVDETALHLVKERSVVFHGALYLIRRHLGKLSTPTRSQPDYPASAQSMPF
jgi:hypothetical protein